MEELVSIVLPTYNGSKYIKQSIDSCLGQTYKNFELIIVVDASRDNTVDIIKSYTDQRISINVHQQNLGLPKTLNTGFALTKGKYLTWTSDDNYFDKHAIEKMVNYLNDHQEIGLVYSDYWVIDDLGNVCGEQINEEPNKLYETDVVGACFLYRKEVYDRVGDYNPDARLCEDYEYWLRVQQKFSISHLPEKLYYYRQHSQSLTSQSGVIHQRQRIMARIKHEKFGLSFRELQKELARLDIDEAFLKYSLQNQYQAVYLLVAKGCLRDPNWLKNRGVASIFFKSLFKSFGKATK